MERGEAKAVSAKLSQSHQAGGERRADCRIEFDDVWSGEVGDFGASSLALQLIKKERQGTPRDQIIPLFLA